MRGRRLAQWVVLHATGTRIALVASNVFFKACVFGGVTFSYLAVSKFLKQNETTFTINYTSHFGFY
jgi:hypothetical protein